MGPIALFDTSLLQSLSVDESAWFDHFFLSTICPLFFVETLADEERIGLHRVPHNVLYEEYTVWCDQLRIQHRLGTKTFALKVWGKLIAYKYAFRYMGRKTVYLVPSAENIIDFYEPEVIKQELLSDKDTEDDSEAEE